MFIFSKKHIITYRHSHVVERYSYLKDIKKQYRVGLTFAGLTTILSIKTFQIIPFRISIIIRIHLDQYQLCIKHNTYSSDTFNKCCFNNLIQIVL